MEYVKKLHKGKKWKKDSHAVIEGLDAEDWLVIDMGNIVLHLFHPDARIQWDLETLWTVGKLSALEGRFILFEPLEMAMTDFLFANQVRNSTI